MKKFIFEIVIEEDNDEFWEGIEADLGQGIKDLYSLISECVSGTGLDNAKVRLVEYADK